MSMNSSIGWNWDDKNSKQANARLEYQEFEPSFDWIWDDEKGISDTLAVFLPGFKEEQSRVEITSNGLLRLSGERKIGEFIKIRRFDKELRIPSDIDTKSMNTKFENDILYVKLPRVKPSQQLPPTPQQQVNCKIVETLVYTVPDYEYVMKERVMDKEPFKFKPYVYYLVDQQKQRVFDEAQAPTSAPVQAPASAPTPAPIQAQTPPLSSLEKENEKGQKEEEKTNSNEYVTKERVMDKEPLEFKPFILHLNPAPAPPAEARPEQQPQPQLQSKSEAPIAHYQDQQKQRVLDEAFVPASSAPVQVPIPIPTPAPIQTQTPPLPPLEKENEKGQKEEEKTYNNDARKVDKDERGKEATTPSIEMNGVMGEVIGEEGSEGTRLGLEKRLSVVSEKSQDHRNGVYRMVEELKKHNTMANLVVAFFLVLLLVLYVNNVINSYFGGVRPKINQELLLVIINFLVCLYTVINVYIKMSN